jgi:hypothetical protein
MCIGEPNMTNSEVLRFIIEELSKSPLSWNNDKELFELICAPISYGNDIFKQRKKIKNDILSIISTKDFNRKKFNSLTNNIICGKNEKVHRKELLSFLDNANILSDKVETLVQKIPCKKADEKNYKNNFNNWKNGNTDRINRREIKRTLEKNFYFSPSLWNMSETTIKQTIREGVSKFVKLKLGADKKTRNLFEELRRGFDLKEKITDKEKQTLQNIEDLSQKEMMEYIAINYPLSKSHSQEFIHKLIPILFKKGYYELLLEDVIKELSPHLQESNQIKKIKAKIYSSPTIGRYKDAFDIISTIKFTDNKEMLYLQTEALSNIKRHLLSDKNIATIKKEQIVDTLISYYDTLFKDEGIYHYYPAINLSYMKIIRYMILDDSNNDLELENIIKDIYTLCKPSIKLDLKSKNRQKNYYANITKLEFMIFQNSGSPILELERFLSIKQQNISIIELVKTQRQMQFLIDSVLAVKGLEHPLLQRVQDAIEVIDDFMEFGLD